VPQPSRSAHLQTQAENYREVFDVCLQHTACRMIVTWGVSDRSTWIPKAYPGWGEPLLLDSVYRAKPAYRSTHELLSSG
jgi:endo-1,4-beta-xylanase